MAMRQIKVANFKSFADAEINLGDFNVLIGPNASGKSNFVDVLRFIRDICTEGLRNAVSLQGDPDFVTNTKLGRDAGLKLSFASDFQSLAVFPALPKPLGIRTVGTQYELQVKFGAEEPQVSVAHEDLKLEVDFVPAREYSPGEHHPHSSAIGRGHIEFVTTYSPLGLTQATCSLPDKLASRKDEIERWLSLFPPFASDRTLLEESHPLFRFRAMAQAMAVFDFDPKLPKRSASVSGKKELESDASNLAIVLNRILGNAEDRRKLVNLLQDALPFAQDLSIARLMDRTLLVKLKESYAPEIDLPAPLMSDGTVNLIALLVALFFENKSLVVIEEPERNIHPALIAKVVAMMKDASSTKQVIVTTHSPEIVKHAGIENILLVSRGEDGFSHVTKPAEEEQVRVFLQNDMGVDELYISDLLSA